MKKILLTGHGTQHIYRDAIKEIESRAREDYKHSATFEISGTEELQPLQELQDKQDLIADAVVQAANDAWIIQQRELTAAVRDRLEALGYRFDSDVEFNRFVMKRVTSHVIRDTTDNVVMLNRSRSRKRSFDQIPLLTYSTAISVENKDNSITIKIG